MNKLLAWVLASALFLPVFGQRNLSGTPEIKLALDKLNVLGSVLMIAAHPDDENTGMLAYWARGRNLETAYLSITRGEGGQNLIGSEQGDLLGVIRTQELLAARRIDGAQQFFTRAIDFGFTKTPQETFEKWGHEAILSDVVWVIRKYQPDCIVLRFSGTPRDGHGQHQASAILGKEAFTAAADKTRFPEQLKWVAVWQAKRLMWNSFAFTAEQEKEAAATPGRIKVDPGIYNPVIGKSYMELAGLSRSEHRSQAMGSAERRGPSLNFFVPVAGDAPKDDLFDGIDITWNRVPGGQRIAEILAKANSQFDLEHPEKTVPLLLEARPMIADLAASKNSWGIRKLSEIDEAIALCSGLWLDAEADRYDAVPGGKLKVNLTAINRSTFPVSDVTAELSGLGQDRSVKLDGSFECNHPVTRGVDLPVPAGTLYSQPFWLAKPRTGGRYVIDDQNLIGRPDPIPVMNARFQLKAGNQQIALNRAVRYRYVDRAEGELIRPLAVVPAVMVDLPEPVLVFTSTESRQVDVMLKNNIEAQAGELHMEADAEWKVEPAVRPFQFKSRGEELLLSFTLTPLRFGAETAGPSHFRVFATVGGSQIQSGAHIIAYSHIPTQTVFYPSQGLLREAPLEVLAKQVGYIMGAGDNVPDALRQMGCDVTLLNEGDLTGGDLSRFDAIVTGVRAYNVRADLRANQQRLLAYVQKGGTMVVQYNVAEDRRFTQRVDNSVDSVGPYPLKIGRDRVTVEESPVEFLSVQSPLLRVPNEITSKDFDGWIQERGLYFASEWDTHYQPVLSTHDPGEKGLQGGMLYARYGKGAYVFTSYSWFRQLPAGVPGAYRIFANLLSAGKAQ